MGDPRHGPSFHGIEENVFERIATMVHATDLDAALGGDGIHVADLDVLRHDNLDAAIAVAGTLTAQLTHGFREFIRRADRFHLQEFAIGTALLLEITDAGNASGLEDEDLV